MLTVVALCRLEYCRGEHPISRLNANPKALIRNQACARCSRTKSVTSKQPGEVAKHFGFAGSFVGIDNPASSKLTQERLGWVPTHQKLLAHLEESDVFDR